MFVTPTKLEKYCYPMNTSSTETGLIQDKSINVSMEEIGSWRKSSNSSEEILDYPVRNEKTLPNFDSFLPKFHFILPNFYFSPPWGIFICSVELSDFLGIRVTVVGTHGRASVVSKQYCV